MTPTPELRFVERVFTLDPFYMTVNERGELVPATRSARILQQKWTDKRYEDGDGEWRDVPVVEEQP